jgi:hypothetical protein
MLTHRSLLGRLLLSFAVCFLLCGIASAEIPELLSLIDNTSNDFMISSADRRECTPSVSVGIPKSLPLNSQNFECGAWTHCAPTFVGAETISSELFLLHSDLRR